MKMTRIAILSLAVVLYATAAVAQHGHSGGAAGMGNTMGSMGLNTDASDQRNAGGMKTTNSVDAAKRCWPRATRTDAWPT